MREGIKKTCRNCMALTKTTRSAFKCELGYRIEQVILSNHKIIGSKPLEPCPKPKTYADFIHCRGIREEEAFRKEEAEFNKSRERMHKSLFKQSSQVGRGSPINIRSTPDNLVLVYLKRGIFGEKVGDGNPVFVGSKRLYKNKQEFLDICWQSFSLHGSYKKPSCSKVRIVDVRRLEDGSLVRYTRTDSQADMVDSFKVYALFEQDLQPKK